MTVSASPSPRPPAGWVERWTRFWFALESARTLALLRIFFGIALLLEITGATGLYRLPSLRASAPKFFASATEYSLDGFRLAYPGFEWLPAPSYLGFRLLEIGLVPLTILFIAGLFRRWVGPTLALLYLYLFLLSQFFYHHHTLVLVIGLLILGFSRCAEHYSLDAYLTESERAPRRSMALPRRLVQVFVPFVYLLSTIQKMDDGWVTGRFIESMAAAGRVHGPLGAAVMSLVPARVQGMGTLLTEGFLAVAFATPALQPAGLWVGAWFHLGIDLMLPVGAYSYAMLALYISYVSPASPRRVVLYDGRCGWCQRSIRAARLLDWFGRVRWGDFRDPAVVSSIPQARPSRLEAEMMTLSPAGSVTWGFSAWRTLFRVLPLTFLFWPLLYIPPVPQIGRSIYARIAAGRAHGAL